MHTGCALTTAGQRTSQFMFKQEHALPHCSAVSTSGPVLAHMACAQTTSAQCMTHGPKHSPAAKEHPGQGTPQQQRKIRAKAHPNSWETALSHCCTAHNPCMAKALCSAFTFQQQKGQALPYCCTAHCGPRGHTQLTSTCCTAHPQMHHWTVQEA